MPYQHFTIANRYRLWVYLNEGRTLSYAALHIGCSLSTVWREIKRNSLTEQELANGRIYRRRGDINPPTNKYCYDAEAAIYKATRRRSLANRTHNKLAKNTRIRNYVIKHLKQRWSPEQIAGVLKKRGVLVNGKSQDFSIAVQAIYNYIYRYREDLKPYLRRRKKYKHHRENYLKKQSLEPERSIDNRPIFVNSRLNIGHWEGDTIVGSKQGATGRIATFVERKTGYLIAIKIPAYTSAERKMNKRTRAQLKLNTSFRFADGFVKFAKAHIIPKYLKTLTLDNGSENADYQYIEEHLDGLEVYFAHPYHSWERGTNENTNGLLRQYFPKGMDFTNITQNDIDKVVEEINNRPRKRLNWNTPQKIMERNHALCTSE